MPSTFRSIFAVVFGFISMFVVVIVLTLIAVKGFGLISGHPTPGYLVYNVIASMAAAFLGGGITGRLAPARPEMHGLILTLVMTIMAALSYSSYHGAQPLWYRLMLIFVPSAVACLGAITSSKLARRV